MDWEPEGVKAVDQARVRAAEQVAVAAEAAERAVAGDLNKSTIQPIYELTLLNRR